MRARYTGWVLFAAALLGSCSAPRPADGKLTVAAAANLMDVFGRGGCCVPGEDWRGGDLQLRFHRAVGHADREGRSVRRFCRGRYGTCGLFGRDAKADEKTAAPSTRWGSLLCGYPKADRRIHELKDLVGPQIRFIAIAQPELAPYGQATVEVLKGAGLWDAVQPKLVYGTSISMAKQFAASGSANAAFTAYSLVLHEKGTVLKIDSRLHKPIEQAMGIVAASAHLEEAKQFRSFLLGAEGRAILANNGYLLP